MKINLPNKKGTPNTTPEIETNVLVVIGANGSGKTRFGTEIENKYASRVHRVSAQKSLAMPESVGTSSKEQAENAFLFGNMGAVLANKNIYR